MSDPQRLGVSGPPRDAEAAPDLLAILRRRWLVVALFVVLGIVGAQYFAWTTSPTFEAESTLLLIAAENESSPGGGRARTVDIDTWATVARSTELLQEVANDLGLELSVVQSQTSATAASTGDILVLASRAPSAEEAVEGASVYSDRFLANRQAALSEVDTERRESLEILQESLQAEVDDLTQQIAAEEAKGASTSGELPALETARDEALTRLSAVTAELDLLAAPSTTGRVVVEPSTAVSRTGLGSSVILLSGLLVGALIGFIAALLRDRYDDRYRSASAQEQFGVEEIARVPYVAAEAEVSTTELQVYGRLLARLAFGPQRAPESGRAVLVLPVESATMPSDAAEVVALSLRDSSRGSGVSTSILRLSRPVAMRSDRGQGSADPTSAMEKALAARDLVLVPQPALDGRPVGIGLAPSVDTTVVLVSSDTRVTTISQVVDDLVGVGAREIKIVVVTGTHHFPLRSFERVRDWFASVTHRAEPVEA